MKDEGFFLEMTKIRTPRLLGNESDLPLKMIVTHLQMCCTEWDNLQALP